jgi:hypothetical protein
MAAPASAERETRLLLGSGDLKLVIFSQELLARPSSDLVDAIRRDAEHEGSILEDIKLASGLRAVIASERTLDTKREAVPVARAYTVLPDETLQVTQVFVSPQVAATGSGGCQGLARKIFETLEAGSARLDLAGGERKLGDFTLRLPPSFALIPQPGPDFDVYHLIKVGTFGAPRGELGIYVGGYPDFGPNPKAQRFTSSVLGRLVTWHRTQVDGIYRQEALLKLSAEVAIHLFLDAPTLLEVDQLVRIAESLKQHN